MIGPNDRLGRTPTAVGAPLPSSLGIHPNDDDLADHALTLDLDPSASIDPAVLHHLAGCRRCQNLVAAVREVGAEVGRLTPEPIPADVAARMAATVRDLAAQSDSVVLEADEASRASADPEPQAPSGRHRAPAEDELAGRRRLRRLRAVSAVAAGLVVLGGGGYLLAAGGGGGSDTASDSAAGAGGGEAGEEAFTDADGAGTASYDRQTLTDAVPELLAAAGRGPAVAGAGENVDPTAVEPSCVASLPVATGAAISITRAIYDGQDAIVVLFADSPNAVQVTVLSNCSPGSAPRVLDEFVVDR